MNFVKETFLICSLTFILAQGFYSKKPLVNVSCDLNALTVLVSFKRPFSGIIFAEGYYLNPFCSSNLPNITVDEAILSFPLFKCGTKFQKSENKLPVIKNTIQIQYHPVIKTIYDRTENISCIYLGPVPQEVIDKTDLNLPKETKNPVIPYRSWINFKLGSDVIEEKEAKKTGLRHKLFLVAYVQDGGKSKDFKVERCFAHDEYILDENTTVIEMNPADNCSDSDSLSEFTVMPNLPYSDLMAYAQVKALNIKTRGELYVTCGIQVCEQICFRGCSEDHPHELNHWKSISTHRLFKRAADSSKAKLRNLQNRNVFLRSTVKALAEQFVELKSQLTAQRNGTNFGKRIAKVLIQPENTTQISDNFTADTISLTKDFLLEEKQQVPTQEIAVVKQTIDSASPALESEKRKIDIINPSNSSSVRAEFQGQVVHVVNPPDSSSLTFKIEGQKAASINQLNSSLLTSDLGEQDVPEMNQTMNSSIPTSDFVKPLIVKTSEELSTTTAMQNTTIFLPALYTDYFMTSGLTIYNRSTASYEPSTVYIITSDDAVKQDKSSVIDSLNENATDTTEEFPSNSEAEQDCVPHFKFLVVTISLGILSFSFLLICVGMWLYIRKERKRTALNSYLLYSFY